MNPQNNADYSANKKKGGKGKVIIIIAVLLIIAALVGVIIFLLMSRGNQEPEDDQDLRNVVITQDNLDEVLADMQAHEFTQPGYYTVTMNNVWHFPTGDDVSTDAYVENAVENNSDVYFDIFLEGDEANAIYKSPVLPIGSSLNQIALEQDLDAGTYDCIMVYHLIDENQETLSTLKVAVTLVIEG